MLRVENYRKIVPDTILAQIYSRARGLYGKHIIHLNATYQGGGVAEMLYPLVLSVLLEKYAEGPRAQDVCMSRLL